MSADSASTGPAAGFSDLPAPLAAALAAKGYADPTPVQAAVSDPALAGQDLLVSAQTGSGKTVAFGIAMAADLLEGADHFGPPDLPRALVIAPTRELAMQVRRELEWLYAQAGAVIASCVGGMDARAERRALERGAHLVVGTPGRLCDHLRRGALDISALKVAVLDEADEMLDLGFREDLEFLLEAAPADRRTLMFSATVRPEIAELAATYQRDARRIATQSDRAAHVDIAYRGVLVDTADRENAIVNLLRFHDPSRAIVFCGTRATVSHLTARFVNRGFPVVALSGELSQQERSQALQAMRDGRARLCIATDVAARGIDLPGLELVVHADLPTNKETLLHRSGRTGRAGAKGISALIVPLSQRKKAERLLHWAGVTAEWGPAPAAEAVLAADAERMLSDPALSAPVTEDEAALMARLMEMPARQLAAGYFRLWSAGRSAPEDLRPLPEAGAPRRDHADFGPAFWISLSVGHAGRAEARWLLPMLCRAGGITRAEIGAIRVGLNDTAVQIAASAEERFFEALGKPMQLEQGIAVSRIAGTPDETRGAPKSTIRKGPRPDRPERADRAPRPPRAEREDRPYRPRDEADSPRPPRPAKADGYRPKPGGRDPSEPSFDPARDSAPPAEAEGIPATRPRKTGPKPEPKPGWAKPKPKGAAAKPGGKPAGKSFGKPGAKGAKYGPATGKPGGAKGKGRG